MTVSQRADRPSRPRMTLSALRYGLLLFLFAVLGQSALAQGLSPGGPVNFGSVHLGNVVTDTLVFTAPTATDITSVVATTDGATNQDFQVISDTCLGPQGPPGSCTIQVEFAPKQIGVRRGALVITDSANAVVNLIYLSGIGIGPQYVFAPTTPTTINSATTLSPATFTAGAGVQDGNGNLFFTDVQNGRILEESSTGVFSSIANLAVTATSGIAIGGDGSLYVSAGNAVYTFMPGGTPTPIITNGVTLQTPTGLAIDVYGDLYIADSTANKVYLDSLSGSSVTPLALTGLASPLKNPAGLAIDSNNNLYIADAGNDRIVETGIITETTTVVSLTSLTLSNPTGVNIDAAGTIYIADTGNARIVELTVPGDQFVLTNLPLTLATPAGIVIQPNGDLYITDATEGLIDVVRSTSAINFPTNTIVGSLDTTDDPLTLTVQSTGNFATHLTPSATTTQPSISTGAFLLDGASTCPILAAGAPVTAADTFSIGETCTYAIDFKPLVQGLNKANLILNTTNSSGGTLSTASTIPLTGNGVSSIASFMLVASPDVTTIGNPVSLTLTALQKNGQTATDYVGTVTFTDTDSTGKYLGGTGAGTNTTTYTFTAADAGVLSIPAATGLQLNQLGTFTAHATDNTYQATSNPIRVVEPSTLTLTSSVNPSLINQQTVFTLTVGSVGPTPTGTANFYSNGNLIGSSPLIGGIAVLPFSFAAAGTYQITATYSGDNNTNTGNAGPLAQVVVNTGNITLTSTVNPSVTNQQTIFKLTVTSPGPTPTGTATFYSNGTKLGTASLVVGVASLPASFATAGTYQITATYSGDNNTASGNAGPLAQVVVNPGTLTLTSSVNPSLINQQTIFTLSIASTGPTPTGNVSFYSNGTLIGTVTVSGGVAHIPDTFATAGTYKITATYTGDGNTSGGTAGPLSQIVVNNSSITLTSSVNPSQVNQQTTFKLTVTSAGPAPGGTATFFSNGNKLGTANVTAGVAVLPASFATAGTYQITATYSGDNNTAAGNAGPLAQVVVNTGKLTLTSSVNPSAPNQQTIFTLTIASTGPTPTGNVSFYSNGTLIGTVGVTGGVAHIPDTFAIPGTYQITATYTGDGNTSGGNAGPLAQVVANPTKLALTSSVNPSLIGQSTTLTATLTALGTPTGTITFFDGGTQIGSGTVVNGAASVSVSFSTAGTHELTASYIGNDESATSAQLAQVVLNPATITLTSSINPSLLNQSTLLTATISTTGTPQGTVTFFDGTTQIGQSAVTADKGSVSVSFNTVGIHPITAVYSGDTLHEQMTSAVLNQDVVNPTSIILTTSVNPVLVNANTTLTAKITSAGTPTGTVTFYSGGTTVLGTGTVSGDIATLAISFPKAGIYSLTAVYGGDNDNAKATSAPISQTVLNIATVALTSSVNPVFLDNPTILTAVLTSTGPTPTGTVTFSDGTTVLGSGTLVNGIVSISASFVYAGTHTLLATYSGDTVTAPATSPALAQTVADFSLTVASGGTSSGSVIAGGTTSYSLAVTPIITTTLPSAISLTVTGLPATSTSSFTPTSIAAGSGATPVSLSVTAAQITAALRGMQKPRPSPMRYAPVALAFLLLPAAWFRRRKRFGSLLASIGFLFILTTGLTGCISSPSSGYYGQTPQTYNVTVTATSGNLARSVYLTFTVQ
jgi:sugar lactone lactonase YvrE